MMIAMLGSIGAYGIAAPLCILGRLFPPAKRWGTNIMQRGVKLLLDLEPWLYAHVDIRLHPGALTVANHRSHLDVFLLLSRIPGIRLVCKQELFFVPFLALMLWSLRQIPIRRGRRTSYWWAMDEVRRGLRAGDAVHVFPEMTRCEPGWRGTQAFHLAPFHVAYTENVPVLPIAIVGTDRVWPKGRFALSFRQPVVVQSLAVLYPRDFSSSQDLANAARQSIDDFLARFDR